jgi:hypothetical protein
VQIVLVEWRYTERYSSKNIRFSGRKTDRLSIYEPHLSRADSSFAGSPASAEDLFFDPFDQFMRLHLLAAAMEREGEMDVEVVTVLHLVPGANRIGTCSRG